MGAGRPVGHLDDDCGDGLQDDRHVEQKRPFPRVADVQPHHLLATAEPDYRIGPGDQLSIEVWKDKDLARLVTVLPDGKVAYPMVVEIVAAGKTVSELQKEIEGKLSLYVKGAVITVEVRQVNSLQIYVLGHVKTSGWSLLTSNDVLQALAIAGGARPVRQGVPDQDLSPGREEDRHYPVRLRRRDRGKETGVEHPASARGRGRRSMTPDFQRNKGMKHFTIAVVAGARSNFMKIAPIVPPLWDGKSSGRIADVFLEIAAGKVPTGMKEI